MIYVLLYLVMAAAFAADATGRAWLALVLGVLGMVVLLVSLEVRKREVRRRG